MRKSLSTLVLFVIALFGSFTPSNAQTSDKATAVFEKVSKSLAALKAVSYHYRREENYPSEGYNNVMQGEMYIDFGPENDIAGFRYQFKNSSITTIFNNAEIFHLEQKDQSLTVNNIKKFGQLEGSSPLLNAYAGLRNALPMIAADTSVHKTVADTILNDKKYDMLQFDLNDRYINYYLGNKYNSVTIKITFNYKIIADKTTGLPVALLQTNIKNQNLNRADFSDINISPKVPAENSWYYSTYTDHYKLVVPGKPIEMIKPGTAAPDFKLTNYKTSIEESPATYSGKVVLLNFWEKNCGYCISQVADLNNLNTGYQGKAFKLLAINSLDSKNNVDIFVSKHSPKYDILYNNKTDVAKLYGVHGYPSVVILDKKGVVIYSGYFDLPKIKSVIDAAI